jgi:hypothetical protein
MSFIESGDIFMFYLPSKDKDFEMNIFCMNRIPANSQQFLQRASQRVSDAELCKLLQRQVG